jgi:hypothetical protein
MPAMPKVGQNPSGLLELKGATIDPGLTQDMQDAKDLYAQASLIDPNKAKSILKNLSVNPNASAGLVTAMGLENMDPKNQLTQTLAQIDAENQKQRLLKSQTEAQKIQDEKFQNSGFGKIWAAIKGTSRNVFLAASTPLEFVTAFARAGYVDKLSDITDSLNKKIPYVWDQLTLWQQLKRMNQGQNLGTGFFPSETVGAGAAARAAQIGTRSMPMYDDKGNVLKDAQGKPILRPWSPGGDPLAAIVSNGHPDGVVGSIALAFGDLASSFAVDPMLAAGNAAKIAKLQAAEARAKGAFAVAEKLSKKADDLAEAQKLVEISRKEFIGADNFAKKIDLTEARKASDEAQDVLKNKDSVYLDSAIAAQSPRATNAKWFAENMTLDSAKQAVNDARSAYADLVDQGRVVKGVYSAEKLVEKTKTEYQQTLKDIKALKDAGKVPNTPYLDQTREEYRAAQKALEDLKAKAKRPDVPTDIELSAAKQKIVDATSAYKGAKKFLNEQKSIHSETLKDVTRNAFLKAKAAQDAFDKANARRTLEEVLADRNATLEEKRKAYSDAVYRQAGIKGDIANAPVNYDALEGFLTSGTGKGVIARLAAENDPQAIWRMTRKGGFPVDLCVDIAKAQNANEAAVAISRYIGRSVEGKVVRSGALADTSIPAVRYVEGAAAYARENYPVADKMAKLFADKMNATSLSKNSALRVGKKFWDITSYIPKEAIRRYNVIIPDGKLLSIHELEPLMIAVDNFADAVRLPGLTKEKLINDIINAEDDSKRGYIASVGLMNAIQADKIAKIDPKLAEQLQKATRAFINGHEQMQNYYASRLVHNAEATIINLGKESQNISGPILESQLLNSHIYMPSPIEIMRLTGKFQKYAPYRWSQKVSDVLISRFWKTMQLLRPAYVIRNIAEEQARVFGMGHISFFNHPLSAMALWLGRPTGGATRQFLNKLNSRRHDVFGNDWNALPDEETLANEENAHRLLNGYVDLQSNEVRGAYGSKDLNLLAFKNMGRVGKGHPRFYDGLANELRIYASSEMASFVAGRTTKQIEKDIAEGMSREDAVVKHFLEGPGRTSYKRWADSKPQQQRDWLYTTDGAKASLYTGVDSNGVPRSVASQIEALTSGDRKLKELIASKKAITDKGVVKIPSARDAANNALKHSKKFSSDGIGIPDINEEFARSLEDNFGHLKFQDANVNVPMKLFKADMKNTSNFVQWFFDVATKFEKTTTMGPEFQQAYWDAINEIAPSLNAAAKESLEQVAKKSLSPLRSARGKNIGDNHPVWNAFKKAGDGPMTLDDAHIYADSVAREAVKNLFYDATEKRQLFHMLRLIAPFGQAWEDTIHRWLEIGNQNRIQVYKLEKTINWLSDPISSNLYKITDANSTYDPTQGFFWQDQYNQRMFWVPFTGTLMNAAAKFVSGANVPGGPVAMGANPMSFNFAFGTGTPLPGIGPGVTIPLSMIQTFAPGRTFVDNMPDAVRNWIFPYGASDFSTGIASAILPNNWNRIAGSLFHIEPTYAATFAPTMGYLASSGDYNLDNPDDATRLVQQTDAFARWFSGMRGVIGLFSPVTLTPQFLAKDGSGNVMLQVQLYHDFQSKLIDNQGDYNKTVSDFLDLYGPDAVFAMIGKYKGSAPKADAGTYGILKKYPDVLAKYKDVFGYIQPSGVFSAAMDKFEMTSGMKEYKNAQDVVNAANELRYYAAKDRLIVMANAEGWDKDMIRQANASLDASFGGGPTGQSDPKKAERQLVQLKELAYDQRFGSLPGMQGLRDYLYARDAAILATGKKTLRGDSSIDQRQWLADQAYEILQNDPGFQNMYDTFFARELEGK